MKNRDPFQVVWGVALVLMGIAVFFRIPHVMARISHISHFSSVLFFLRFGFYMMSVLLIGGGIKKLYGISKPGNGRKVQ